MEASNLILTDMVSPPEPLMPAGKTGGVLDEKKKQFAKEFESVLIGKLLDEMKDTIGEWGLEKDGTSRQIEGIFWLYLARDIGKNGGLGMWKDIYEFLNSLEQTSKTAGSVDSTL